MMPTAISANQQEKIRKIQKYFPDSRSALLPILFYLQEENRYLDEMVLWDLSEFLFIDYAIIKELAEYYVMLRPRPVGQKIIRVCTNVACTLSGGEELCRYLEEKLGVKPGETTSDGKYTLLTAHCLACCDDGPAIQINDRYYKHISFEEIDRLMEMEE